MQTWIYKGSRKADTYLYVNRKDDFSAVPNSLLELMGELRLVVEVQLSSGRKLAQADAEQVMQSLRDQGYYLQLPPGDLRTETPC